jgi:heat shock protein HslJ
MTKLRIRLLGCAIGLGALATGLAGVSAQTLLKHRAQKPQPAETRVIPLQDQKQYQTDNTWVLKQFNDKPPPVTDEVTFTIDSTYRGYGFSGCNTWSATIYPIKNQKFAVGPIAVTHNQCDKVKMEFEVSFLTYIHSNPSWDVVNGDLIMKGQGGTMLFQRSL